MIKYISEKIHLIINKIDKLSKWRNIYLIINNRISIIIISISVFGYFILFSYYITLFIGDHNKYIGESGWKLNLVYYGSYFALIAFLISYFRCPDIVKNHADAEQFCVAFPESHSNTALVYFLSRKEYFWKKIQKIKKEVIYAHKNNLDPHYLSYKIPTTEYETRRCLQFFSKYVEEYKIPEIKELDAAEYIKNNKLEILRSYYRINNSRYIVIRFICIFLISIYILFISIPSIDTLKNITCLNFQNNYSVTNLDSGIQKAILYGYQKAQNFCSSKTYG